MRRRLVCVLVLVAALASAGHAAAASPQVAALQLALSQRGLYHGPLDGIAGPQTRRATKRFQRRHRLQIDGIAGAKTRARLGRWARHELGDRLLSRGRRGWDVAELQFLLAKRGLRLSLDGLFGSVTRAAVRTTQRRAGLAPDGVVGPRTLAALRRGRRRVIHSSVQAGVRDAIDRWSRYYGVEPGLACALAWMESGHQPNLRSRAGAWGVFQVIPATWLYVERVLAGRQYPHNVEGNVRVGLVYLRHLLRTFGDTRRALAAWYTGPGQVRRHGVGPRGRWFAATVLALRARC